MSEEQKHTRTVPGGRHGGRRGGGPGGALGRPVEKAKNFKGTLKRLLFYLKPQRVNLTIVVLFAVIATTFTVLGPKITGNAINELTEGYIAKSIVNGIEKAQPKLKDALDAYNDAIEDATKQADDAVSKGVGDAVSKQKEAAYAQAAGEANKIVTEKFNEAVAAKKQDAYKTAVAQADAIAEQKFNEAVAAQKQAAYAQAKTAAEVAAKDQVDQNFLASSPGTTEDQLSSLPGYSDALAAATAAADSQATAEVDAKFSAMQATLDSQLAAAKTTAEGQAKSAVDAAFAAQQTEMDAKLADAKATAAAKAKAAVDAAFSENQAKIDTQIADAKQTAEQKAKDAVDQAFMDKEGMTKKQLEIFLSLAALPDIKSTDDYNERAEIAQKIFDGMKLLPSDMTSGDASVKSANLNLSNISSANLHTYINDIRKTGGNIPYKKMEEILVLLLCIYVASSIFSFLMQFIMSSVAQTVVYNMRKDVNRKLARLPLKYYDSHTNGEILSRMTNDMDTVSSTLQQSLTQLIQAVLQIIGYVVMMLTISPLLTLFVMLTLPLYILATTFIAKKSQKFYAAQQKHLGELSGHTEEMYTGHKIVKAFGREQDSVKTFEAINDEYYNAGWKAQFLSGVLYPVMNFISNLGYVLISVVGGIFVTKTWLSIGDITAFIQYSRQFSMPIIQTANIANIIQSTVACAERVFEILDEAEELPDAADAVVIAHPRGEIVLDQVDFSYKPDEPLIQGLNLNIKKGETIAVVGPTGAGKTTLVNLLMRFYEINGGEIRFDGVNINDIKRGELRTMFGMVLQDTWLFTGTIEENIRYGREDATFEEIVAAADAAYANHFIRSLPMGYQTVLNEEASNISQGQKQLLTIARAILANPTVLILDEATSSVDTRTEVLIQKAMGKLMEGRTNFVIAHRLSTIRDAQLILVMNHGTIVESGNHLELMAKKGFYADLYNSQFTGPVVDEAQG